MTGVALNQVLLLLTFFGMVLIYPANPTGGEDSTSGCCRSGIAAFHCWGCGYRDPQGGEGNARGHGWHGGHGRNGGRHGFLRWSSWLIVQTNQQWCWRTEVLQTADSVHADSLISILELQIVSPHVLNTIFFPFCCPILFKLKMKYHILLNHLRNKEQQHHLTFFCLEFSCLYFYHFFQLIWCG